ncbi:DUF2147 domain-containing protein [Sulfitobacter guttiformis]|nr:DUF2147 domain-containing protein [Sulfitobacter guttiformis]
MKKILSVAILAIASGVGTAQADVPIGLWQSNPDNMGIVLHVRTRACGRAICGQVERVKDRRGYDAPSRSVGHRVLINLVPDEEGMFSGDVWEPASNKLLRARMKVEGNLMRFENCNGMECSKVTWRRVR